MLQNHHTPFMYLRCLLGQGLKNCQPSLKTPPESNRLLKTHLRPDNGTSIYNQDT